MPVSSLKPFILFIIDLKMHYTVVKWQLKKSGSHLIGKMAAKVTKTELRHQIHFNSEKYFAYHWQLLEKGW